MTLIQGRAAKGAMTLAYPAVAGAVVASTFTHLFKEAPALGDVLEIGCIPHGCKLHDVIVLADGLDDGNTLTLDGGVISGQFGDADDARVCGDELFTASPVAQAGGVARPTKASAYRIPVSSRDVPIGLKVAAAPTTFVPGSVSVTLFYVA